MINIKFKSLYLKNFKCHDEFTIDLSENKLLLIVGKNGSGKTSIMDAITWAIYDETISGQKGDDVVNNIAKKDCYVQFIFDVDNTNYEVRNYRKHTVYKNSKILLVNGVQVSTDMDVKQTNDILRNVLLEKDIFLNCLLFSQYIKKSFLKESHSGQKDILDQLLSFDKFDDYYDKVHNTISEVSSDIDVIKNKINILQNTNEIHHNNLNENLNISKECIQTNEQLISKHKITRSDLLDYKKQIETMYNQEKYNKFLKARDNKIIQKTEKVSILNNLESNIESNKINLQNEYSNKFKIEQSHIENKYEKELNELNSELNSLNYEISEFENKVKAKKDNLDNKLSKLDSTKLLDINNIIIESEQEKSKINELYSNKLNNVLIKKQTVQSKYIRLDSEINNNKQELDKLSSQLNIYLEAINSTGTCPECKQELLDGKLNIKEKCDTINKNIEFYTKKINTDEPNVLLLREEYDSFLPLEENIKNELKEKMEELDAKCKVKISEINNSHKIEVEKLTVKLPIFNDAVESKKIEYEDKKNKLNININALVHKKSEDINKIKDNILIECKTEINNMMKSTVENIEYVKSLIAKLDNELVAIENELKILESKSSELDTVNKDIMNVEYSISHTEKFLKEQIEKYKQQFEIISKNIEDTNISIESYNSEIKNLEENLEILRCWKRAFSDVGIKSILLDESIPILNSRAKELCEVVDNLRITFSSQTALKSGKSNNKFNIDVVHNTHLSEYSNLSAGETKLANIVILLCLRHLLEKMAGKRINILLLDEILDSLDESNSELIVKILMELSSEYTVLLITHTQKDWIPANEELRL